MARQHESRDSIRIRTGEDVWSVFEHAERVLRHATASWAPDGPDIYVTMKDTGGSDTLASVADARASLSGTRHELVDIGVWARSAKWDRRASVTALNLNAPSYTPKWIAVAAEGPDEAAALGLSKLLIEEVLAARAGRAAPVGPTEAAEPSAQALALETAANKPSAQAVGSAIQGAPRQARASSPVKTLNHPWVVGIATGLIVAAIVAVIALLL